MTTLLETMVRIKKGKINMSTLISRTSDSMMQGPLQPMRQLDRPLVPELKKKESGKPTSEQTNHGWMGKLMLAGSPILSLLGNSQFQTVATKGYSIYDGNPRLREQLKQFAERLDVVFDIVKTGLKSKSDKIVCAAGQLAKSASYIEAKILELLDTKLKQVLAHSAGDLYWYISEISRYEAALSLELGIYIARSKRLTGKVSCSIPKREVLDLLKKRSHSSRIERIADDITGLKGLKRRHARLQGLRH